MISKIVFLPFILLLTSLLFAQTESGELFITTEPTGATLIINGDIVGTSPFLLTTTKAGQVRVTAELDGLLGESLVLIAADELTKIHIILQQMTGRIFILNPVPSLTVKINNEDNGKVGEGLIEDIPVGDHRIEIIGDGQVGKAFVTVEANKTTNIDIPLTDIGSIAYVLPKDSVAGLTAPDFSWSIEGSGSLEGIPVGELSVIVTKPGYMELKATLTITRSEATPFAPVLEPNEETRAMALRQESEQQRLLEEAERQRLLQELNDVQLRYENLTETGWIFTAIGGGALAGAITTVTLSFFDSLVDYRTGLRGTALGLGVLGGLLGAVGLVIWLERPDSSPIERALSLLKEGENK